MSTTDRFDDAEPPEAASTGDTLASVTRLLVDVEEGNDEAWNQIYNLVYHDLHRIARSLVRQHVQPGISPTSLVSETWLRLARSQFSARCRSHLTSLIARAMRFVLLDEARRTLTTKRGNNPFTESLSETHELAVDSQLEQLLEINEALERLVRVDSRLARVVELRYFGGLEEEEIGEILGITVRTVRRDWRKARAFLQSQLDNHPTHS
ncbi:ECF-type sigma factor [Pseudoxanthomonas putridarboris]|uniref:ECF-type sigma factor n=1 Tax=Pseudoxanthomonas putridarboris TaxID=752605 RepID=A0ABU9J3R6_9GAMM